MSGVKESVELLDGVAELAKSAKKIKAKVMADGKVSLSDLPAVLPELLEQLNKFDVYVQAIQGLDKIPEEAKDLDSDEAALIIGKVFELIKAVKE